MFPEAVTGLALYYCPSWAVIMLFWDEDEDESSCFQCFLPTNVVSATVVCTEAGMVLGSTPATCFLSCTCRFLGDNSFLLGNLRMKIEII